MNVMAAQGQYPQAATAPREIGILTRVDGIAVGLRELQAKLSGFGHRLSGEPSADEQRCGCPSGIAPALAAAEASLRDCHQIVDALHKAL